MNANVVLKSQDLLDFNAFMVTSSKKARKMRVINTLGVFAEIVIAFFIVDIFLKTQYVTILGFVLAAVWLFYYPKFLKRKQIAILKGINNPFASKQMRFEVGDEYLCFYEIQKENANKFKFSDVSEIYECKNIFIIFLFNKIYIILPINDEISKMVSLVAKNSNKHILKFENLEYKSVVSS